MFKIGTLADWFGVGLLEGIRESQRCGATGVQIYAWNDLDPAIVSKSQIQKVKDTAKECHQEIVALCGELGGNGLERVVDTPQKIAYLKGVVDLATEFDCSVITTHIGVIPKDTKCERYHTMLAACHEIGLYAAKNDVFIAIETGPEPVCQLKAFVDQCSGIGINYDPANLVMVTGDDEVQGVHTAGSSIVHTHAKDGICNHYVGPKEIYSLFAKGGIESLNRASAYFTEMPLGQGSVRWHQYLQALSDIGYKGYLTIEREVHQNAAMDIRLAVEFLKQEIQNLPK